MTDKELDLPHDAEHYRRSAKFYLSLSDKLQQENALLRAVLKTIWEQGGDVTEVWSSSVAGKVLMSLYAKDAEENG